MELREWRKREGLTLAELAVKLDTTVVSLSRYETKSRRTIRAKMIEDVFILTNGDVDANDLHGITPERIAKMAAKKKK